MRRLKFLGIDGWGNPIYKDKEGRIYCDLDPVEGHAGSIYTMSGNDVDGEPEYPVDINQLLFDPARFLT